MFNLEHIIKTAGYAGIFGIIFAESGLLIGFFLPGDSLLFTAGFLASQGFLNIALLLVLTFVAAVTGDSVGYWFGKRVGPKIFSKEDSLLFKKRSY
jgi:membrane-associated protein